MSEWDAARYDSYFGYVSGFGEAVLDLLGPKPGETVLDLGCGTGELAEQIAAAGAEVIGIDSDAAMVAAAKQRLGEDRVRLASGSDFVLDEPVDAVFSNAALHWMRPPEAVGAAVRGALKPGGRFVAEFGARRNVAGIIAAVRAARSNAGLDPDVPTPWYFPSPAQHATLLESAGFDVVRLEYFPRLTPLSGTVADWVEMFGSFLLDDASPDLRPSLLAAIDEQARPLLHRDGQWFADYWRLRFVAVVD